MKTALAITAMAFAIQTGPIESASVRRQSFSES